MTVQEALGRGSGLALGCGEGGGTVLPTQPDISQFGGVRIDTAQFNEAGY